MVTCDIVKSGLCPPRGTPDTALAVIQVLLQQGLHPLQDCFLGVVALLLLPYGEKGLRALQSVVVRVKPHSGGCYAHLKKFG